MRNIRNILSVVCGYVAAVIGAGFASGQEIISFFVKYGKYSIIGVLLSCVIFSVFAIRAKLINPCGIFSPRGGVFLLTKG